MFNLEATVFLLVADSRLGRMESTEMRIYAKFQQSHGTNSIKFEFGFVKENQPCQTVQPDIFIAFENNGR